MDVFRGLIMLLMAWDHTQEFLKDRKPDQGSEMWSGKFTNYDDSNITFLSRSASHFCAPGFFLTMGIGMQFWTIQAMQRGTLPELSCCTWFGGRSMENYVRRYFITRGMVLIVCGRIVNVCEAGYIWVFLFVFSKIGGKDVLPPSSFVPIDPALLEWFPLVGIWQVLVGLGTSMMVGGLFCPLVYHHRKLGSVSMLVLAVASMALSAHAIVEAQGDDPADGDSAWPKAFFAAETVDQVFLRFLLIPGRTFFGIVAYPLCPWVSLTLLGFPLAVLFRWLQKKTQLRGWDVRKASKASWIEPTLAVIGLQLLAAFFFLRFRLSEQYAKYFSFRGYPRGEFDSPYKGIFTFCKYPPDACYILVTTGVNFLVWFLLSAFLQLESGATTLTSATSSAGRRDLPFLQGENFSAANANRDVIPLDDDLYHRDDDGRFGAGGGANAMQEFGHGYSPGEYSFDDDQLLSHRYGRNCRARWCFFPSCVLRTLRNLLRLVVHIAGNIGRCAQQQGAIFRQCKRELTGFLYSFGVVPLFFYMMHYLLLATVSICAKIAYQDTNNPNAKIDPNVPLHWPLWALGLVWLGVVLLLRKPCEMYNRFKRRKSKDSLWRLF
eukprot:g18004.t1